MRRILQVAAGVTFLLVWVLASAQTPAPKHEVRRYVIVNGDMTSGSWSSDDWPNPQSLRSKYGEHFAWFRDESRGGGHEYVITDSGVMAELDKAEEPQKKVNAMQADVNREQSRVNALQAKVNAHQNDVNALQHEVNHRQDIANQVQSAVSNGSNAALIDKLEAELRELRAKPEISQASVNQMQSQVNEEQHRVNAEQAKVNEMQRPVNDEQHRVSAEFAVKIREIFGNALENGTAREIK